MGLALKRLLGGFPGGRHGSVPQLLIIITDGKSQGPIAVPAQQLRERGIVVFAVGVRFPRSVTASVIPHLPGAVGPT